MESPIDCRFYRRFGIELEVNTLDGVVKRPDHGEIPFGADYVCGVIHKTLKESVELQSWDHIHNNKRWIVKPDNSCGIEINSPVLKGWLGLKRVLRVIDALKVGGLKSDHRCSLHVHVNISDLSVEQLASVVAYYIKCEHIFFDSVPDHRKNSRYCQFLGVTDLLSHDFDMHCYDLLRAVSDVKYYSINCYHFMKGGGFNDANLRKRTIEFRVMEGDACLNSVCVKNWVRLLLHFVETTSKLPLPRTYHSGDKWSSLLWLDPQDMFEILNFHKDDLLSLGMKQVRDWFLSRLLTYGYDSKKRVLWSNEGRSHARCNFLDFMRNINTLDIVGDPVYGKNYIL